VLVSADRDRLTAGATPALGRELDEQREDVVPVPGLGVELVDHVSAHALSSLRRSLGGGVADHDQAENFPLADDDVVRQDQLVAEVGLVALAVVPAADDRLALLV